MAKYKIEGGSRLSGEIKIHGAKNSVLPILAATLLTKESTIHNCPDLTDVVAACNILRYLGCAIDTQDEDIHIVPEELSCCDIPDGLMREMRSSVVFLGAIIARCGKARVSLPGGCELGPRPIDLHLSSLEKLGVVIAEDHGYLECSVPDKLRGANILLPFPSVGATENIMLAACTAEGDTVIHNPAREPEIEDLANFLNKAGAKVTIRENGSIYISGVQGLTAVEYSVIPDRIAAATYLCCAAITGGEVLLKSVVPEHMNAIFPMLEEAGCAVMVDQDSVFLRMTGRPKAIKLVRTMPYPGFPTDAQSPLMALSCIATGTSVYVENIFESRYKHAAELARMGARINIEGRVAVVEGVETLHGATMVCTDLRGGAALVTAALAAEGMSEITHISHIERGYQDFDKNLASLGANIVKV
ncbi:MAG: UDP-N-acetylglucosamine 1-carboxyvinyltransferase [Oscillospiraceae bacterium]|jgi:UDP-N-acetylglucosamine 1-carboxyvinyltransferase|nr:UDP-N-acetylglucosamine 1-carboxyvinyltransferase [Oscillospiraceae bacterium]